MQIKYDVGMKNLNLAIFYFVLHSCYWIVPGLLRLPEGEIRKIIQSYIIDHVGVCVCVRTIKNPRIMTIILLPTWVVITDNK